MRQFLVHTKRSLKGFTEAAQAFFSVPVEVEVIACHVDYRDMVTVRSPLQGNALYPCLKARLKGEMSLTRRQLRSARRIDE
jgi:hypothetical protein